MATTRYDQRKNLEEGEANAIGTEYVRVDLLPPDIAANVRTLLIHYTDLRIQFYKARRGDELNTVNAETSTVQSQLWSAVAAPAKANPTSNTILVISGMNDVLNSQGLYAGRVVEPNTPGRLDPYVCYRHCFPCAPWLWSAQ